MIRVVYLASAEAKPALLDTHQSSPPVVDEIVKIDLDTLNLRAYSEATQEAIRLSGVTKWRVTFTGRTLRNAVGEHSASDFHEAVVSPVFDAKTEPTVALAP